MSDHRLTEAQVLTELELLGRLAAQGIRFDRRRVQQEREPHFIEGWVHDVHVWIYDDGGASVVGRGADLMIEKESYRSPEELRNAIVDTVLTLATGRTI